LSLFLTFFVMGPTLDRVYQDAYVPYTTNAISFEQALDKAEAPMRSFMLKQTRQSDFALFSALARLDPGDGRDCAAARAGAGVCDQRAQVGVSDRLHDLHSVSGHRHGGVQHPDVLGMMMLSPVLVALPFKLMLFVLADGWNLLIGSLAASFVT
jgi:flagellar biosynthetic protein FliP